jgi:hypothetical protein
MFYYRPLMAGEFEITKRLGGNKFLGTTEKVINVSGILTNQAVFQLVVIKGEEFFILDHFITD